MTTQEAIEHLQGWHDRLKIYGDALPEFGYTMEALSLAVEALKKLERIAATAHAGGLIGMEEREALVAIRRETISTVDGKTFDQLKQEMTQ